MVQAPEHSPKRAPKIAPLTRLVVVATRTSRSRSEGVRDWRGFAGVRAVARRGGGWK